MKIKQKLLVSLTIIFVISALALGIILPLMSSKVKETSNKNFSAEVRASGSASDSGASSAPTSQKGGAIYIDPNTNYTMNGGTISGKNKTYGGAVFISTGATFTMNGGTITNCSAQYGGGIYVSTGATLTIKAGTITGCTAEQGPAIYIEDGAIVNIDPSANISKNDIYQYTTWVPPEIGAQETVGSTSSSFRLRTLEFGSFPQTYVGSSMNSTLESWYSQGQETKESFKVGSTTWTLYEYNGEMYARGTETKCDSYSKYKDNSSPTTGRMAWFKVEPLKWYILNYETMGQDGYAEILSTQAIVSNIAFSAKNNNLWANSDIRSWLNDAFIRTAFDDNEKGIIQQTTIRNNVTGNYDNAMSDNSGIPTQDKIYLKSYWEMANPNGVFKNKDVNRYCSPTDFAIGNNAICYPYPSYTYRTVYRNMTCFWWLRSAGPSSYQSCFIRCNGATTIIDDDNQNPNGCVRPALHINLKAS